MLTDLNNICTYINSIFFPYNSRLISSFSFLVSKHDEFVSAKDRCLNVNGKQEWPKLQLRGTSDGHKEQAVVSAVWKWTMHPFHPKYKWLHGHKSRLSSPFEQLYQHRRTHRIQHIQGCDLNASNTGTHSEKKQFHTKCLLFFCFKFRNWCQIL